MPGCFLPEDNRFAPLPNAPPTIVSTFPSMESIVTNDPNSPDAGMRTREFSFLVYDANVGQELEFQTFVAPPIEEGTNVSRIRCRSSADCPALRPRQTFQVSVPQTGNGCVRVKLFVSSAFSDTRPGQPLEANDVATAVWWIATRNPDLPGAIDMLQCVGSRP